jgi:hypothetical protein
VRRVGGFADRLSSRFQHVTIEALIGWPLASLIQILVQVF